MLNFIIQTDPFGLGAQPDDLKRDIEWLESNGLMITESNEEGITDCSAYICTSYPEVDFNKITENSFGVINSQGEYLYCVFYVRRNKDQNTKRIPMGDLRQKWREKYPNIKWLYFRRLSDDRRVVKVAI